MLLFRSEEHVDRWCAQWGRPKGEAFELERGLRLALAWFSDRLDVAWRRRTLEEVEEIFGRLGFTSQFWSLR